MIRTCAALLVLPVTAMADVPAVVTDFAPIYSLTAKVMEGVGVPANLLPPGAEPHDYDMSPTDAAALASADLVIWIGSGMTPWLADPIATLAPDARQLTLLETEGWTALEPRTEAIHDESHGDHGHDDHGHDDHGHDHGPIDPHAWLDPDISAVWLSHIADVLSDLDPGNAARYAANAAAGQAELQNLSAEIATHLEETSGGFILPHDGYQYFEVRFGLPAAGSIASTDAHDPGPARIAELRDMMQDKAITCVLTDRETDPAWAALLIEGTDAKTAVIDATAADYPLGPDAYAQTMRTLALTLADCVN